MDALKKILPIFVITFCLLLSFNSNAATIHLAGLIVNASDLKPLSDAKIFNEHNQLLGASNNNGYYDVVFNCNDTGEIYFKLKIEKRGFSSFTDREHWGKLGRQVNMIIYFGLSNTKEFASFTDFASNTANLVYNNVLSQFDKVKKQRAFEQQLAEAERGNQDVLFRINNELYIADNFGWIKINSEKDIISINNKEEVAVGELNAKIKRKDIKGMTPLASGNAKFEIDVK